MKRLFCTSLLFALVALSAQAADSSALESAKSQTLAWLSLTDAGQSGESWESASALFKAAISKEDWEKSLSAAREPLGTLESREMATAKFNETLPGAPDGEYFVFQFNSSFEYKDSAIETVTAMKETDGSWRVAGYYIK
ncbi:MAG: DUF4019 domain-containing protein [Woeseiaceae bacterium]